jgi:S1-C subfamily serine protease
VVKIQTASGLGSGVIVDSRGYIVTNYHVVFGAGGQTTANDKISVTLSSGQTYTASIASADAPDDLAVLKITAPRLQAMPLADSGKVRAGEFVLALGNPLGYSHTVTFGIVSAPKRTVAENGPASFIPDMIQTSAPINPGNSGGALVDLAGRLIGIPTLAAADPRLGTAAQGIGFAVPSNRVAYIMEQVLVHGKVVHSGRPYLGLAGMRDLTPAVAGQNGLSVDQGAIVTSVVSDGPAARAGVRAGDVLVRLDGQTITSTLAVGEVLARLKVDQRVSLTVARADGEHTFTVTLGELPVA